MEVAVQLIALDARLWQRHQFDKHLNAQPHLFDGSVEQSTQRVDKWASLSELP